MTRNWTISTLVGGAIAATMIGCEDATPAAAAKPREVAEIKNQEADVAAIKANVEAFSKAYQARDVKAIAALFAPEAKLVTEDNDIVEGRDAIAQVFADHFAEEPNTQMEVNVGPIRMLDADLAVETGTTKSIAAPDATPEYGKYTVLHAKKDGTWQMLLVRDMDGSQPSNHERLLPLAWMVGDWVDESQESVVATSCRWSDDKNFLIQDVRIRRGGKPTMQISQRIGWDPLQKRVRSWAFDSEGGYGDGVWTNHGEQWVTKSNFVSNDGVTASATNVFTRAGKDAFMWRSADRVVGDEILPTMEVTVVRKAPAPVGVEKAAAGNGK